MTLEERRMLSEEMKKDAEFYRACAKKGWNSPGHKERVLAGLKKFWTEDRKKEMSIRFKETPKKFVSRGFKGHKHTAEMKKKLREYGLKGRRIAGTLKPNKAEKKLGSLLKGFKFVGDGSVEIAGKNPDFLNKKDKKIVELYGDYWHSLPGRPEEDKRRIRSLKSQGYKVLVVWEHELKSLKTLKKKLEVFV